MSHCVERALFFDSNVWRHSRLSILADLAEYSSEHWACLPTDFLMSVIVDKSWLIAEIVSIGGQLYHVLFVIILNKLHMEAYMREQLIQQVLSTAVQRYANNTVW